MATENGSAFLLKVGDGAAPPSYRTVAGLRTTQLSVNGEAVTVTTKDSRSRRTLLSGAGVSSVSVSAVGICTGSAAEVRVRGHALAGTIDDFELSFESGERLRRRFLVSRSRSAQYGPQRRRGNLAEPLAPASDISSMTSTRRWSRSSIHRCHWNRSTMLRCWAVPIG